MNFEFEYGSETIEVMGSVGYVGDNGDYYTPPYWEAVYNSEDLQITVYGEHDSYEVEWKTLSQELKKEIVRQIEKRV